MNKKLFLVGLIVMGNAAYGMGMMEEHATNSQQDYQGERSDIVAWPCDIHQVKHKRRWLVGGLAVLATVAGMSSCGSCNAPVPVTDSVPSGEVADLPIANGEDISLPVSARPSWVQALPITGAPVCPTEQEIGENSCFVLDNDGDYKWVEPRQGPIRPRLPFYAFVNMAGDLVVHHFGYIAGTH